VHGFRQDCPAQGTDHRRTQEEARRLARLTFPPPTDVHTTRIGPGRLDGRRRALPSWVRSGRQLVSGERGDWAAGAGFVRGTTARATSRSHPNGVTRNWYQVRSGKPARRPPMPSTSIQTAQCPTGFVSRAGAGFVRDEPGVRFAPGATGAGRAGAAAQVPQSAVGFISLHGQAPGRGLARARAENVGPARLGMTRASRRRTRGPVRLQHRARRRRLPEIRPELRRTRIPEDRTSSRTAGCGSSTGGPRGFGPDDDPGWAGELRSTGNAVWVAGPGCPGLRDGKERGAEHPPPLPPGI
jgi:hypothetical protein